MQTGEKGGKAWKRNHRQVEMKPWVFKLFSCHLLSSLLIGEIAKRGPPQSPLILFDLPLVNGAVLSVDECNVYGLRWYKREPRMKCRSLTIPLPLSETNPSQSHDFSHPWWTYLFSDWVICTYFPRGKLCHVVNVPLLVIWCLLMKSLRYPAFGSSVRTSFMTWCQRLQRTDVWKTFFNFFVLFHYFSVLCHCIAT